MKRILSIMAFLVGVTNVLCARDDESTQESTNSLRQEVETQSSQDRLEVTGQSRDEQIWKSSCPIVFGYGNQQLDDKTNDWRYKSSMSVYVSFRKTYYLHKEAIKRMMKFGLDASFFEINYANYGTDDGEPTGWEFAKAAEGTFQDYDEYFRKSNAKALAKSSKDKDDEGGSGIGKHTFNIGVGVGPSVKIVPFYYKNDDALDKLKVSLYAHYVPSFCGVIMSADKTTLCGGYMGMIRYGFNVSYGRWGLGVEHYTGSAKLKNFSSDNEDAESLDNIKYDMSGTRFYIGFRF